MATLVVQQTPIRQSRSPPPHTHGLTLDTSKFKATPIPNKHIPYCSPGPAPSTQLRTPATPPASPPSKQHSIPSFSILHPVGQHSRVIENPPVYSINADILSRAINYAASQPLPDPKLVFPWLHGLHPENQIQLAFFIARRKALRKAPTDIRGITIVKAGGDISKSKLKGALSPQELLSPNGLKDPAFYDIDPREGFSVRNFQIQAAKMAMVSDIIVYGDENTKVEEVRSLAKKFSRAQKVYREHLVGEGLETLTFNTFVVSDPFAEFEENHPEHVAINSKEEVTGNVMDFFQCERQEMCTMSKASEISNNVWLGPTPESTLCPSSDMESDPQAFDVYIEASDMARTPDKKILNRIAELSNSSPQNLEFPSSGSIMPPTWSHTEVDGLLDTCKWIYRLANPGLTPHSSDDGEQDSEGDIPMKILFPRPRRILIHCTDGYTESSLLALTYFMYAECIPVHDAWIRMHCEKMRNFFSYPSDVALLTSIQPRIIQESPLGQGGIPSSSPDEPVWLKRIDGSLPSRILPYMYLGNLNHANNPELLIAMGIRRVLSVGEPVSWSEEKMRRWGAEKLLFVDRVQDNGVDPLTDDFDRCLEFIEKGKAEGTATLVHCRVGVSRSATICIAEVMASMGLSFPRAYCFVRARRLNVIIQPHLRFAYELLKWEEVQQLKRGIPIRRELEWASIAREIAAMNKPYTK
ncbi:tyrosine/serine/threonine protein phosphatase pps1 [Xylographa soralifera]|nr:tyrosine/serine/threonine protein phosphatase pps1 [Xylographa soralifera]